MKKLVIVLILIALVFLFFSGCTQLPAPADTGKETTDTGAVVKEETPPVTEEVKVEEPVVEEEKIELPLKFTYTSYDFRNDLNKTVKRFTIFYLEKEIECNGEKAIAGIITSFDELEQGKQGSSWAKFTLYLENGDLGSSKSIGKSELAFDDTESFKADFDMLTQLNRLFIAAEKNFITSEVWESDIPVILKDSYYNASQVGDLLGDFSIIKKQPSKEYSIPCTEFSVNIKGMQGFTGELLYCIAEENEKSNQLKLPFTVSLNIPGMQPNELKYELESIEKKSSDATFYPQCMEPVYCEMPKTLTEEEKQACYTAGKKVSETRDEKNCITEYKCLTNIEYVKEIVKQQHPSCPEMSDELATKALPCVFDGKQPKNIQQDEKGCIIAVEC